MRTYCTAAAEHAQVAQALTRIVLFERQLEPLAHHVGGDAIGVADDRGGVERAQRGSVVLGAFVDAVGRVVGHLVVVPGDALARGRERVERGEPLDVGVGERVDGRCHGVLRAA